MSVKNIEPRRILPTNVNSEECGYFPKKKCGYFNDVLYQDFNSL